MKKLIGIIAALLISVPVVSSQVWNGLVHIEDPEILEKSKITLNGQWEFYPGQEFISFNKEQNDIAFIKVPGSWIKQVKKNFQADTACYRIKIVGLKPNTQYAIYSRRCPATASKFYCNGKLVASYGVYSSDRNKAKPANVPVYAFLESDLIGSIELVIQVSCYSNFEAGLISPVVFASHNVITRDFVYIILYVMLVAGALLFTCIVNFSLFFANRQLKIHLIFGFLLLGIMCHLVAANSNLLSWSLPGLSYKFIKNFEYVSLLISPVLFALIMMGDKVYTKKLRFVDISIIAVFSVLALIFFIFPVEYTNYLVNLLWLLNAVFFIYSILRMSMAFATKQIRLGIFISFYILIAGGYFFDILFPEISAGSIIMFNQVTILLLQLFDVFFMAWNHQIVLHKTEKAMVDLENEHNSYKKFVSDEYLELINTEHPESVKHGDNKTVTATILDIHLIMIYSDGRVLQPRSEFEANAQFMKIIYDVLDDNNGIVASSIGNGCIALFKESVIDAFNASREIIRGIRRLNELNVKLGEASAMFSCGIHTGTLVAGVIGDDESYSECLIGDGLKTVSRIEKVSMKFGIPILVSQKTIDMLEGEKPCRLSLFHKSIITPEDGELYLYECHDEDYSTFNEDTVEPTPLAYKEVEEDIYR